MKRAGIGGVELSFLEQNGEGWGSEQWFTNLSKILYHANRLGIEADIMPGVHWVTSAKDVFLYWRCFEEGTSNHITADETCREYSH